MSARTQDEGAERDVLAGEPSPPPALLEAQSFLERAFRSTRAIGERHDLKERVDALAKPSPKLPPTGRVDVYREQFWSRHQSSLREDFPTLERLLGEGGFAALCEHYLEAYPPRHFMLRNLSSDMPKFVAEDPRYAHDRLLADCARLEWAFLDAVDAADPTPFDSSPLAGASEEALFGARFVLQPPLRLLALEHPAHEFREAVRTKQPAERPAPRPTWLVVFRTGEDLRFFEVERAAYEVVRALSEGKPLAEACNRAIESGMPESEVGTKLGQWFQWWTQWNWMVRVEI